MIILDFETNSSNVHDVIEVAAFRVERVGNIYKVLETFHRYYLSLYEVNPHALAVHKLSPERLERLRKGVSYEEYFEDDADFVAHNISFKLRHIGELLSFEKHFCAIKEIWKIKRNADSTTSTHRLRNYSRLDSFLLLSSILGIG